MKGEPPRESESESNAAVWAAGKCQDRVFRARKRSRGDKRTRTLARSRVCDLLVAATAVSAAALVAENKSRKSRDSSGRSESPASALSEGVSVVVVVVVMIAAHSRQRKTDAAGPSMSSVCLSVAVLVSFLAAVHGQAQPAQPPQQQDPQQPPVPSTVPWYETLPAVAMDYKVIIDPGKEDCYFQFVNPGATFYASAQVTPSTYLPCRVSG